MKHLKAIALSVLCVAGVLSLGYLWLACECGVFQDYGVECGYYGQFNRVKHTIEQMPNPRIVNYWMHKDISLEDFGFYLAVGGAWTARVDFTEGSPQMAERSKEKIAQFIEAQIASSRLATTVRLDDPASSATVESLPQFHPETSDINMNPAWVIGNVPPPPGMQRVSELATSKAVLIQEQTIGRVPVVFESQSRCLKEEPQSRSPPDPVPSESSLTLPLGSLTQTNLVTVKGRWISEVLPTDTYSGVKEFAGVTNVGYTYFLAQDGFSTGTPIRVAADTNSVSITLGRVTLPVSSIPLFMEVVDDIARKELGSTNGTLRSDEPVTFTALLRRLPPESSGSVVSVHLTNERGLSLLSGGSYLDAYFGWTNGVSRLDALLKTEKPGVLFSVHLRLDLESGLIWN